MVFFFITLVFMYVGRKIGWVLSKKILYTTSPVTAGLVSVIWGICIALSMFVLIRWQNPNIVLKIIMGYVLGWYIAIPNFGLFKEDSITNESRLRHLSISVWPSLVYILTMVLLSFYL